MNGAGTTDEESTRSSPRADEHNLEKSQGGADDQVATVVVVHNDRSTATYERKWRRLRKHYSDAYLELLKDTHSSADDDVLNEPLASTQLGAVMWQQAEKVRLYHALSRKGRHDLLAIVQYIGSKSETEVRAYLNHLSELELDRQLFEDRAENVSYATIPAAQEIGFECETVLDQAASALLAFQERYDYIAAKQSNKDWLIDHRVAAERDRNAVERYQLQETNFPDALANSADFQQDKLDLFCLSSLLELSERFFMNRGPDDPDSWQNIAEMGQRPALTVEAVEAYHELILNFMRRVIRTSIFIATARIRSTSTKDHRASKQLKSDDVHVALDMLGLEKNTGLFWVKAAERGGLDVVDDSHRKGTVRNAALSYVEVERALSASSRSRTHSVTLYSSGASDASINSQARDTENEGDEASDPEEVNSSASDGPSAESSNSSDSEADETDSNVPKVKISKWKRQRILEEEQDEYLEAMDQQLRRAEEARLMSLLGIDREDEVKQESVELPGIRPKGWRKSKEDCMGWAADLDYEAEWEGRAKRRKVEDTR
jgi:RNA polymerase I-specific transcription initiation factor RRN5